VSALPPEGTVQETQPLFYTNELTPLENISKVRDLPDGSSLFEILNSEEGEDEPKGKKDFYDNLAEELNDSELKNLAINLIEKIEEDKDSRQDWEKTINLALKYLGFKLDEFNNVPFMRACSAYDSTLSISLIRFCATAKAELFPAAGPARSEIVGVPTQESEDEGERVRMFMNHYLTQMDSDYYPDSDQLLWYVGLFGSAFRKVYQDPIFNHPVARVIKPQDFIVNVNTNSLMTSDRQTHVIRLSRREIILRQKSGEFVEFDLPNIAGEDKKETSSIDKTIERMEGISPDSLENKSLFEFFECHVDLEASQVEEADGKDKLPRPYIVTICSDSKKVVSIRRNWKEGDNTYNRRQYFVRYYYLPGFGIYSLGMAHIMGSNSIVLTSILRLLVDSGTLNSFPGGLRKKGLRIENNDKAIGPAEFHEVETNDLPIDQCIMLMPYKEPSTVLANLYQSLIERTSGIPSTAEAELPDIGANAPVGTTLAMLEVANKVQSSVLRGLHVSLGAELKLLFNLFGEHMSDEPYPFSVPGSSTAIMKKDFSDRINIVPVSDPNVLTSTHRLISAESILKLASSAPDIHDMREVYKRMYSAMNIENVDKLMPEPPKPIAVDPLTENAYIMTNKPITISLFQDHQSHIIGHKMLLQDPMAQANPQAIFEMQIHIQKHKAFEIVNQMIQEKQQLIQANQQNMNQMIQMGGFVPTEMQSQQIQERTALEQQIKQIQQMDPNEVLALPEIQNKVAAMDAEEIKQQQQQALEEENNKKAKELDPNQVMLAEIEQRREASLLKEEEAKLKAETEAFKAQLKFESDKAKRESQEIIASEKNQVDLEIEHLKNDSTPVLM